LPNSCFGKNKRQFRRNLGSNLSENFMNEEVIMKKNVINRREMLGSIAALGATATLGLTQVKTAALNMATPPLTQAEMTAVDTAMGKKGKYVEAENTYTVPLPRNDLKVTVKGEAVPISFGFGGWVSVKKTMDGESAVLMSDTVLLEEEVNPLVSAAHANGLEISAIHNHFFYEQPRIFICTCTEWERSPI